MSHTELDRFGVITRVPERRLTQVEAARMLNLGVRQVQRLCVAVAQQGADGLVSRKRGQVRSVPKKIRQVIVATLQDPSESMPQVTDLFYLERLEFLIETGALEVVKDAPEFLNVPIVSAKAK
jgi:hypothetical protein